MFEGLKKLPKKYRPLSNFWWALKYKAPCNCSYCKQGSLAQAVTAEIDKEIIDNLRKQLKIK